MAIWADLDRGDGFSLKGIQVKLKTSLNVWCVVPTAVSIFQETVHLW